MKQVILQAVLLLLPLTPQAKCLEVPYAFEGRVLYKSGKPAQGTLVGASWIEFGQAGGPALSLTDRYGRYRIWVRFHPGNDMPLVGEACTDRLERINIIAYAGDQSSYPTGVSVTALKQELKDLIIDTPVARP